VKKEVTNHMKLELDAISANESFARTTVAAFAAQLNPTLDEINDLKTAVSEAVTNSVVHGYDRKGGNIIIECELWERGISIIVRDFGIGISNIERALEPFWTTRPEEERSGMGFTVMQSFMDKLKVESTANGTIISMCKNFA
jgi:stage II sporulation protein AB (anti-sigma F factor)